MSFVPGTRVGAYEIVSPLGRGGMGEVFRARDTRLGRDVALKVLPAARRTDPALRVRFEREAQALAALSHPRIAGIHDIVESDGHYAIVMELVTGATLADVIARGPVPVRTALAYAIDIVDALAAAHAAGIVHRDLKPSNVVITPEGSAKVLDFGIAKLVARDDPDGSDRGTTDAVTDERAIVGTLGYLSPEQASGGAVDGRSDIFSLGSVMHEMIAGVPAFRGDSPALLIASVLRDDPPPLRTIAPAAPRGVERCVARCLEKDPRRRYQSAVDLKAALEDLREDLQTLPGTASRADLAVAPETGWTRRVRRAAAYLTIAAACAAAGAVAAAAIRPPASAVPLYRPFIAEGVSIDAPAWSPDGRMLAYSALVNGRRQIFVRAADAEQSTQVTRTGGESDSLFWSPDGARLFFMSPDFHSLVSVSAGGGEPQPVVTAAPGPGRQFVRKAATRSDGGTIVFAGGSPGTVRLWAQDTRTGEKRPLEPKGMPSTVANVDALAFAPDGSQFAVIATTSALNQAKGAWIVEWPGLAARHLFADAPYLSGDPSIAWLPDSRRFVTNGYPIGGGADQLLLADIAAATLAPLSSGQDDQQQPTVTPDGRRIAFVSRRAGLDLIEFPIAGGPPDPLVATSRNESFPDMTATGMLAYITDADGPSEIRVRASAGSWPRAIGGVREPERDRATRPRIVRLSPDGQRLAVDSYGNDHVILIYPTAGGAPVRVDTETTDQHGASWSPDGSWLAYRRMRGSTWELVKSPLGGGAAVHLAASLPGGGPTDWSPRGDWIAQHATDGLQLVSADGRQSRLLAVRPLAFRFSRDGSQLLVVRRGSSRRPELAIWDVASGRELRCVEMPLSSTADVLGMTVSPDGSRVIVGAGAPTSDIWILEQFEAPARSWMRWLRR